MSDLRAGPSQREPRQPGGWRWRFHAKEQRAGRGAAESALEPPGSDLAAGLLKVMETAGEVTLELPDSERVNTGRTAPAELLEITAGLLQVALKTGASDLLIEPSAVGTRVRLRRDGRLEEVMRLPSSLHAAIVAELRAAAGGSGHERPRIIKVREQYDITRLRIHSMPSVHGEHVTVRILNSRGTASLHQLGFFPDTLVSCERVVSHRGLFVVSGPVASGRTTTLYAVLNRLNDPSRHLLTLEEPVERLIPGVVQMDREAAAEASSDGIRSCLRHAPDVLMVGDPHESELPFLAEQAGGCVLLAAAWASSAAAVPLRLSELGVPRHVLASNFAGALNQRLVRRLCETCKQPSRDARDQLSLLLQGVDLGRATAYEDESFYSPAGCEKCRHTGYHGQIGLFEMLEGTPAVRQALARGCSIKELEELAVQEGTRTLREDGLRKAAAGITSIDEVVRVLGTAIPASSGSTPSFSLQWAIRPWSG